MPTATTQGDPRDLQTFLLHETRVRRLTVGLARALFGLVMTLSVKGVENLPRDAACIVAANHLTTLDVFPLQFALPRPIFFMAKAELFANPLLAWLVRQWGVPGPAWRQRPMGNGPCPTRSGGRVGAGNVSRRERAPAAGA